MVIKVSSSTTATCFLILVPLILLWTWKVLNMLWLRPKRFERVLRSQGLQGNPYKLVVGDAKEMAKARKEAAISQKSANSLSNDKDIAPHLFTFIDHIVNKFGNYSFFWEGTRPKVILTNMEQIKEVFNKNHDFEKPQLNPLFQLLSTGLANLEGEKWQVHRRIITPAFYLDKLKIMIPIFYQCCDDLVTQWEGMLSSDGKCEIDVWPFLQNMTCDVISKTAFGSSYEEGKKIFVLLKEQARTVTQLRTYYIPGWWLLPTAINKKMRQINRDVRALLAGIVNKREKAMAAGEVLSNDLLGILLESNHKEMQENGNKKTAKMTNQDVVEECNAFYLAGQETTSVLLVWTMILLSRFPDWQERAREEVLNVIGNQKPDYDGLSRLKIVTMILYEVLRLYPPIMYFSRAVKKDVKLGNLFLPKGVHISLPILLIHQNRDIWGDDATEFKPERFSEGVAKATKGQVSFFPFGWGPRVCVGQNFAMLEAKMALALLLRRFSFELSPSYAHAPVTVLTLNPKFGAHIIFRKL
ncbi:11-oxo-beta-amyrin 30-oxidase-like isoform X1 [Abrus precatorius]|uniref:11-oxo-beta-amyrin 30-oxidase-like isoform X1 n=1 Tax=Abrus precatorius TaxID=3816 RepID=A0A8B8K8H5_ABRPR|nr:11-oxo-beta-amyrin 30-oxidase-like isoform X1 [Abrus precatorius]